LVEHQLIHKVNRAVEVVAGFKAEVRRSRRTETPLVTVLLAESPKPPIALIVNSNKGQLTLRGEREQMRTLAAAILRICEEPIR
jgi:hypothetical protein